MSKETTTKAGGATTAPARFIVRCILGYPVKVTRTGWLTFITEKERESEASTFTEDEARDLIQLRQDMALESYEQVGGTQS